MDIFDIYDEETDDKLECRVSANELHSRCFMWRLKGYDIYIKDNVNVF